MGLLDSLLTPVKSVTDIASNISGMVNSGRNYRLGLDRMRQDQQQFDETSDIQRSKMGLDALANERSQNMSGIGMLANNRAQSMANFKNARFNSALLKILGGQG